MSSNQGVAGEDTRAARYTRMFEDPLSVWFLHSRTGRAMHSTPNCPTLHDDFGDVPTWWERIEATAEVLLRDPVALGWRPCRACSLGLMVEAHLRQRPTGGGLTMLQLGRPAEVRDFSPVNVERRQQLRAYISEESRAVAAALGMSLADMDERPVLYGLIPADYLPALRASVRIVNLPWERTVPDDATLVSLFWQMSRTNPGDDVLETWRLVRAALS